MNKTEAQVTAIREALQTLLGRLDEIDRVDSTTPAAAKTDLTQDSSYSSLNWKPYKSRKGDWIFSDSTGAEGLRKKLEHSSTGRQKIGSYKYVLSHGDTRDFIARYPL